MKLIKEYYNKCYKNANGIFSSFFVQDFGEENKDSYNNLIFKKFIL